MEHRTRDGAPITMHRIKNVDPSPGQDRGWITHRVTAIVGGVGLGHLSISWIPDFDERYPDLESYSKAFGGWQRSKTDMDRTRAFHGEPFVAAVLVDFFHHRRYIGLALYRETALWLAEEWGHYLRQGDPNNSSEALWAKLRALGEPVIEIDVKDYWLRLALDYRGKVGRRNAA